MNFAEHPLCGVTNKLFDAEKTLSFPVKVLTVSTEHCLSSNSHVFPQPSAQSNVTLHGSKYPRFRRRGHRKRRLHHRQCRIFHKRAGNRNETAAFSASAEPLQKIQEQRDDIFLFANHKIFPQPIQLPKKQGASLLFKCRIRILASSLFFQPCFCADLFSVYELTCPGKHATALHHYRRWTNNSCTESRRKVHSVPRLFL